MKMSTSTSEGARNKKVSAVKIALVVTSVLIACAAMSGLVVAVLGFVNTQHILNGKTSLFRFRLGPGGDIADEEWKSACKKIGSFKSEDKEALCVADGPFTRIVLSEEARCSQFPDVKSVVKDRDGKEVCCFIKGKYAQFREVTEFACAFTDARFVKSKDKKTGICLVPRSVDLVTISEGY